MYNNMTNDLSLILQALNLELLFKDYNNTDLMRELQRQDSEYLEKIIKQNERIIELLERREENGEDDTTKREESKS